MPKSYTFHILRGDAGERLDRFLLGHLPKGCSRAQIQRWIASGEVSVDGQAVKPSLRLKTGQAVALTPSNQPHIPPLAPEPIPLDVVYEDAHLLVINKQPGLVTHPAQGHWTGTLVQAVLFHLKDKGERLEASGREPMRPGIVHRLDKDTSGLLIVAKTEAAHRALSHQLAARKIHRTYLAVVEGLMPRDSGTVNAPIGRHPTHRKEFTVRAGGREAVTHYRVLKRISPASGDVGPYSVLEVQLETGRTHQIRVHLAHIGHPVLGDPVYGRRRLPELARQLLHAKQLAFTHPMTGRDLTLQAPLPADMRPFASSPPHP